MVSDHSAQLWRRFGLRLGMVLLLALFSWVIHGLTLALLTAVGVLILLLTLDSRHLIALGEWIDKPRDERFPSAGGLLGDIFLSLARHLRTEGQRRQALQDELQFLKDSVEALPNGMVLLDRNHQILWCNRRAEQHLGVLRDQDTGRVISQLFRQPGFNDFLNEEKPDKPFLFPGPVEPNRPSRLYALDKIDYGVLNTLLITSDVTEVQRAETMRRDFVANVSHELRTPLTVVSGFLEHLGEAAEIPVKQRRHFVDLMNDQSQRMLRLVDDLLTLSRLDADDLPASEESIDVASLLETIMAEGEGLSAGRHGITIPEVSDTPLRGNRDEIRSAFGNLLSNAIRYTPVGGEIRLAWAPRGLEFAFSVTDTGVGVAPEHVPRLTERFYRVDKGRSRESGGTGLGLAIVKHVLLRHHARLEIESEPGQGSVFTAVFPAWRCDRKTAR